MKILTVLLVHRLVPRPIENKFLNFDEISKIKDENYFDNELAAAFGSDEHGIRITGWTVKSGKTNDDQVPVTVLVDGYKDVILVENVDVLGPLFDPAVPFRSVQGHRMLVAQYADQPCVEETAEHVHFTWITWCIQLRKLIWTFK